MDQDFNESFNEEGEKPQYMYKRNPLIAHSFQIFRWQGDKSAYEPVGEYTLIDMSEDLDLTEKKVMNLITILNGRKRLIDFKNLTQERILFNIVTEANDAKNEKAIFRTYDGSGVSKENAVLIIEKGVFNDSVDEND